jgi:hypothetical protein
VKACRDGGLAMQSMLDGSLAAWLTQLKAAAEARTAG